MSDVRERGPSSTSLDVRFTVPLYTMAAASRFLHVKRTTFETWAKGYVRRPPGRRLVKGSPLVTRITPERSHARSVPFIGLSEGMVLAAFRQRVSLQRIRPALDVLKKEFGIEHALASQRLYFDGAEFLWDLAHTESIEPSVRQQVRELVRVRDGQGVFHQVVEDYLERITYESAYAQRIRLPEYEIAEVLADPRRAFGQPYFAKSGVLLEDVLGRKAAGEEIESIADDYSLPIGEVEEAVTLAGLEAA
jgi:uncharacterized protein (DUF433 family)